MLNEVGNKIRTWFSSLSLLKSDKEWEEEFEREIDAQVDAVFNVVNEMGDSAEADGIATDFNDAAFLKTMDSLSEKMKIRRRKNSVSLPTYLAILVVSILLIRYSNPTTWIKEYHL